MSHVSPFVKRHIGPDAKDQRTMLDLLGVDSLEALIDQTIPASIRHSAPLAIEAGLSEEAALAELAAKIGPLPAQKSLIGQGYYGTHVPPVIARNMLENPSWYTSYTPYQPEISQGRLEMLYYFQTLVTELTGLPMANASLLDEGTAIAEAVGIAHRQHRGKRGNFVVANDIFGQSADVLATRTGRMGIEQATDISAETSCVVLQWPDRFGAISDPSDIIAKAKEHGALVIVAADPLALVKHEGPANWGADIVVGSLQRFGVPMGNGGPHAAFMAVSDGLTRIMPGRLIGLSVDRHGNEAYRLSLQTREQHIRREKATSNICTAQALLANMAAAYAIWHGPDGLADIAERVAGFAARFAASLKQAGIAPLADRFFDTVSFASDEAIAKAENAGFMLADLGDGKVAVSFDETVTEEHFQALCAALGIEAADNAVITITGLRDKATFLSQEIFHAGRSETEMMRLLKRMADKDLALDTAMIPLGSCTMKLNAAAEMMPISWAAFSEVHPFAPDKFLTGYKVMIDDLDRWLSEITGFAKVSFQPNAGSQGEFAGLLAIQRYHQSRDEGHRNIVLIPASAHGTNPASAQLAGMKVVVVKCDEAGNVDMADFAAKIATHAENLAALMITYPSTHGVFEVTIKDICAQVHAVGGQIYLDGANLNAQVGLVRIGDIGADVCHMNLHKTFCIPHGGGGPGVGPIGVGAHLVPFLPGHVHQGSGNAVSSAPFGSASILPITWMYIRMMGPDGLKSASEVAILSANYLAARLDSHFPVLYKGANGRVAHECILDVRGVKESADVSVDDIAKRLIDYGFHAPTMSWPVVGTLMVEPTESEPLSELDRFADAMGAIRAEIARIESGDLPRADNPLGNAPHTAQSLTQEWDHPYGRELAVYPAGVVAGSKFWPPVGRVDNVHGDRNLQCSCPPLSDYAD